MSNFERMDSRVPAGGWFTGWVQECKWRLPSISGSLPLGSEHRHCNPAGVYRRPLLACAWRTAARRSSSPQEDDALKLVYAAHHRAVRIRRSCERQYPAGRGCRTPSALAVESDQLAAAVQRLAGLPMPTAPGCGRWSGRMEYAPAGGWFTGWCWALSENGGCRG